MPKTPSIYELQRDSYRHPTYWRSVNNTCAPHFHSSLELSYVRSGEMDALIDGNSVAARAGELLVVPSYSVHRFVAPVANDTTMLVIPLDYIGSFRQRMAGQRFAQYLLPAGSETRRIARCLQVLLEQPERGGEPYIVRGQIYTILGTLLEALPLQAAEQAGYSRVQDILGYLHDNYRHPVSLQQIAAIFGYSQSRISHIFNKNVGCSIPEYINTLRARAAANLLMNDGASITDVALEAGFESMRTFYRSFKNCFGVTPSHYLQLSQNDLHPLMQSHGLLLGQQRQAAARSRDEDGGR